MAPKSKAVSEAETIIANAEEEFILLARRAASGETVQPARIAELSQRANKKPTDFDDLTAAFKHRDELRKQSISAQTCMARVEMLQELVERSNDKLEAAVQEHQQTTEPLHAEMRKLKTDYIDASVIPTQLMTTCPSRVLRLKAVALDRDSQAISNALNRCRDELDRGRERKNPATIEMCQQRLASLLEEQQKKAEELESNRLAMVAF